MIASNGKYKEINMADVTLLGTQSMGIHDMLANIIGQFYTGNISQIIEVLTLWRGAFFYKKKQNNGAF